jgi:Fic family protein
MRETGTYQKWGNMDYFIPHPLPPNPALQMDAEMVTLYGEASFALGQLNEMSQRLPDINRFIKAYVVKEALLSSAIEGIHTTLIEVLTLPLGYNKPSKATQLVLNYTHALDTALKMLQEEGLPLVARVILKAHEALMGEGGPSDPGSFRKQPVRVGELIPPPSTEISNLISNLEKYIHEEREPLPLIKAGLVHVHFETIHPFLDGNGRIGRLLIVLMLIESGLLKVPVLYPSYFFKKHRMEYYQRLDSVRLQGDFEGWIKYYLKAVRDSALDAYRRAKEIEELEVRLKAYINANSAFNKIRETALSVLDRLFSQPVIGAVALSNQLGKAYNTVRNTLQIFIEQGFIVEETARKRNKVFHFRPYLELLEKEYLPEIK